MRDDNPSPQNAPPGSGGARTGAPVGIPPWQEMGEDWASIMTAWADLTTGWTALVSAWMRASGSWMGMNPFMGPFMGMNPMTGMNPFMGGPQATEWARQVMECMGRMSRNVQPPTGTGTTTGTTASTAPAQPPLVTPEPSLRPHGDPLAGLVRSRPHAPPTRRASEDHVRGIIAHRSDTSDDLPPLADGT